jgi:2-polyprenyl-6-methoxyphenol hydroxylase-like FAD-dependent oxidoreductase
MPPLHIAIVGYGTAGQAAALALLRDGHRVEVFERAERPGPVGAGFLLQPTGLQALWQLELLDPALRHGARVQRLFGDLPSGRGVMDMRYAALDACLFGLGMQRGALFELLHRAWLDAAGSSGAALHSGCTIASVDALQGVLIDQQQRRHGPFDLLIAADGSASRLRAALGGVRVDAPYPWGALWCLLAQGDWRWPDELRQRYRGARHMIGVLPVGTRPGDPTPRVSFFWSLRGSAVARWREQGMPAWRREVVELWPDIEGLIDELHDAQALAVASYRDVILGSRWHRDRLVLLGDAAHAMSPQLGQGVNMALLDAIALRDALRAQGSMEARLQAYARQRRAHVAIYQFWSRWLTPLFQSDSTIAATLRDLSLLPMGRLPGGRDNMLRVLTGTRRGWLGQYPLDAGFVAALSARPAAPSSVI